MNLTSSAKPQPQVVLDSHSKTLPAVTHTRDQAVQTVKRTVLGKKQRGHRLSVVEAHLAASLSSMERGFFAPSIPSVVLNVGKAFVRPAILCSIYAGAIVMTEGNSVAWLSFSDDSGFQNSESSIAAAEVTAPIIVTKEESNPQFITDLAFALASDQLAALPQQSESVVTVAAPPADIQPVAAIEAVLPKPAPVTQAAIAKEMKAAIDPRQISDLEQQQSLIKFISGLIAAFRPSIQDCGLIARYIVEISSQENVDPLFIAAVIGIESRFHSGAESGAGALGLMQIMPDTARHLAKRGMASRNAPARLMDPRTNIKLGIDYIQYLERKYRGNRFLALAAYNWGPGNVDLSRKNGGRIPGSVRDYSNTIMTRADRWRKHFKKAAESAEALEKSVALQHQTDTTVF